jgi:hypothetical protein
MVCMKIATGLAKVMVPVKSDKVDFASTRVPEPKPQPDVALRVDAGDVPLLVTFKSKNFRKSVKAITPGVFGVWGVSDTVGEFALGTAAPVR